MWVDKAYPRGGHGLLCENLSTSCGTLPYNVLNREALEASKAAQPITTGLGCSSWRVGKTLLLKTVNFHCRTYGKLDKLEITRIPPS